MTLRRLGEIVECLFEDHKFMRRSLVYWCMTLITLATYAVFKEPEKITAASATAISTITGLLTVVIGFYLKSRELDEKHELADKSDTECS